ncbi:MAG: DUF4190 domain-containing protein [Verrucomicrobiota bacterium]
MPPPVINNSPLRVTVPPRTNGFAIASLVLTSVGWVTICCGPVVWIIGIIFSSIALSQIKRSAGTQTGKGMALAGLWLSIAGLLAIAGWMITCCQPVWNFSKFSHHGRYW